MHRSYLDTLAIGVSLRPRRFRAMAKYELFFVPLIGRAIALGGGFPVKRGVQDMAAYDGALQLLRDGTVLLVFPEGTRNRNGKARPQLGAARLALDAGAAFLPVAIEGTERIKLVPPRFPRVRVPLLRARAARRPAGRRPAAGVARSDQALERRGRRRDRGAPRLDQAARWSSMRWRCSCSQAWCQVRTRAAWSASAISNVNPT